MFKFRKVTSENLKNREASSYLRNLNFSGVICNEFWLKVKLIRNNNLFVKEIYQKKKTRGEKNASPHPV